MSITVGIEIIKKDKSKKDENKPLLTWKRPEINMWITEFLFRKHKNEVEWKEINGEYYCIIPKMIMEEMANTIQQGNYDYCEEARHFLDDDLVKRYYFHDYAEIIYQMLDEIEEDEEFNLYDFGN